MDYISTLVLILRPNLQALDKYIVKNLPNKGQIAWCKIKDLPIHNITDFEKLYLSNIKHQFRKEQFLAGRFLIKSLANLPGTDIDYDLHGAPYFILHPERYISLSHSDEMVAVAHSNFSIGIDIQKHSDKIARIIPKFMSLTEIQQAERTDANTFAHFTWCAKEAMFKACREGGIDFRKHLFIEFEMGAISKEYFQGTAQIIKNQIRIDYNLYCYKLLDYFIVAASLRD